MMDEKKQEADVFEEVVETNDEPEVLDANESPDELETLRAEIEALKASELRIRADFDNFRRRTTEEAVKRAQFASQSVVERLLPLMDNFERALQAEALSEDAKQIQTGVDMIHRQLSELLAAEGVQAIEAVGQPFDPNFHQAVMQEASTEFESGVVMLELQKGYMMHDRVLRPSMVKVSE